MSNMNKLNKLNIGIFLSGKGTTFNCVDQAIRNNILQIDISFVVVNRENKPDDIIIEYCKSNNIEVLCYPFNFKNDNREFYLENMSNDLKKYCCDMYLFLGWNIIVNEQFIDDSPPILNLHPALPNTFIGKDCISKAYTAFTQGKNNHTGSMVHRVIKDVDKGEVLDSVIVKINDDDTLESLIERVKSYEKELVISVLQNEIIKFNRSREELTY